MAVGSGGDTRLHELAETLKRIFYSMEEGNDEQAEKERERKKRRDGGDLLRGSGSSGNSGDGTSTRRMRDDINSNEQMAKENRRMLVRIDERTAWIARLIVGVFMAIIGGIYLSGGF